MLLRPNRQRARLVGLAYGLSILASIGLCVADKLALTLPDWPDATQPAASSFTQQVFYARALLVLSKLLLSAGGYIMLIRWLWRAYGNLHHVPGVATGYPTSWAAVAWVIPCLNLVRPLTIVREVWQGTQRVAFGQVVVPDTLPFMWWAAYLSGLFLPLVTAHWLAGLASELVDQAFSILTLVLAWRLVWQAATFEAVMASRLQASYRP